MTHYSPRQRQVIELIAREGMSYAEVAGRLGIHVSTVKVHVDKIVQRSGLDLMPRKAVFKVYREMANQAD